MNKTLDNPPADFDSQAPFGTVPRRSAGPLVFWCLLYVLCFAGLLWLSGLHVGLK